MVGKTGVARLALVTGVPVIPVAHWGAPVDLSAYEGRPIGREVLRGATAAVMADITALLAQLRGEPAPAVPYDLAAARRAQHTTSSETEPPGDPPSPAAAQA